MADVQEPLPWGEIHHHRSGFGAASRGQAASAEPQFSGAGVDLPAGYVVSLVRLHERGFGVPVGRFMRALCDYYGAELHNFSPNSISQAAVFVAVCEGYPGIKAHWDLWIHLFRGELFVENVRGQPK